MNAPPGSSIPATTSEMQTAIANGKRRKLDLKVSLEVGADGRVPVHQVFSDGTFVPASDSHFERTSAAASALVTRAIRPTLVAAPAQASASAETRATDSDPSTQWAAAASTHIETSMFELGRAIAAIEAIRAETPVITLTRAVPRSTPADPSLPFPPSLLRDAPALLMAKRVSMLKCADALSSRAKALEKWLEGDNAFCDAFLTLRKRCHGVRRAPNGTALIDVGDANFVPVRRPSSTQVDADAPSDMQVDDARSQNKPLLEIDFPRPVFLKFGVHSARDQSTISAAPVVQEVGAITDENNLKAFIRRIRLSRVSAFRRKTFELLAKEAASLPTVIGLDTNSIVVESGPGDILRVGMTTRRHGIPAIDINSANSPEQGQTRPQIATLLQDIASHATLVHNSSYGTHSVASTPSQTVLERVLTITTTRSVVEATERVLDDAVRKLRVRLEWSRGTQRPEEVRVRVYSTVADGDGPERALATIEPISHLNNCGHAGDNGHVRIIPAFGVIIPSPDDPTARGRTIPLQSTSSSSSGSGGSVLGLDDVPRAYVCPVGGEIIAVLTLLLCIRLLDALETVARASVEEMLDVDRQCFTVIVASPRNGKTLKVKAWPRGDGVGEEIPGATAWLNGQRVEDFPSAGSRRVVAWKKLLHRLVKDEDVPNKPPVAKDPPQPTQNPTTLDVAQTLQQPTGGPPHGTAVASQPTDLAQLPATNGLGSAPFAFPPENVDPSDFSFDPL